MNQRSSPVPATMRAARLHGPADLRLDTVPHPGSPGPGQALLRVRVTGLCGSDLHSYLDARIGDTRIEAPLPLGHEFSAVVDSVGADGRDGYGQPLQAGLRVAVDPAQPCGCCECCEQGHPNLCPHQRFCGNYPAGGSLCEWILMPARGCFPVPDAMNDAHAALLEPLGVALHAVDLAKIRPATSAAVLGAGPIGLLILQLLKLTGADPIFVTDKLPWRLQLASQLGGVPIHGDTENPVARVRQATRNRGVDTVIEVAWGGHSIGQAAELARYGGRLVLVGIPSDDRLEMKHSTARRKGLTIMLSRRMKHVYPRAIRLVERGAIDLGCLLSHHFPLAQAPEAFALNAAYADNVVKVIIES